MVRASSPSGVVRFLVDARNPTGHSQVLEERDGTAVTLPAGFSEIDRRTYGDTMLVIARFAT